MIAIAAEMPLSSSDLDLQGRTGEVRRIGDLMSAVLARYAFDPTDAMPCIAVSCDAVSGDAVPYDAVDVMTSAKAAVGDRRLSGAGVRSA